MMLYEEPIWEKLSKLLHGGLALVLDRRGWSEKPWHLSFRADSTH
jgi:hypothetical protein